MTHRTWILLAFVAILFVALPSPSLAPACCPAPHLGKPVVNADQTVIILWDPATKTEHFIRQASFKSEGDDFGFLVPTPTQPELNESGDHQTFEFLRKLTEPEVQKVKAPSGGPGCTCAMAAPKAAAGRANLPEVRVLEEKTVAGFNAVVLEADSADALVNWLKEHEYAYSPEVQAWVKPYVDAGWKITALKVAKAKDEQAEQTVNAAALRMTFKTDRPLFPYREPDSKTAAESLGARNRLLRIYFLADARYRGELTRDDPWTGSVAWAGALSEDNRKRALDLLKLPETTGPQEWWLTEFEDNWPYRVAPADVYFSRDEDQSPVKRPPIIEYVSSAWPADGMAYALAGVLALPILRRVRQIRRL